MNIFSQAVILKNKLRLFRDVPLSVISNRIAELEFDESKHPRDSKGSTTGGQWVSVSGSANISLNSFEDEISKSESEIAGVFSADGKIIFQTTDNKKGKVSFTNEQYKKLRGSIITHNHPHGITSLAPQDVELMLDSGSIEVRAVGSSYVTSMRNQTQNFPRLGTSW